jgi:hypothetical protein
MSKLVRTGQLPSLPRKYPPFVKQYIIDDHKSQFKSGEIRPLHKQRQIIIEIKKIKSE